MTTGLRDAVPVATVRYLGKSGNSLADERSESVNADFVWLWLGLCDECRQT